MTVKPSCWGKGTIAHLSHTLSSVDTRQVEPSVLRNRRELDRADVASRLSGILHITAVCPALCSTVCCLGPKSVHFRNTQGVSEKRSEDSTPASPAEAETFDVFLSPAGDSVKLIQTLAFRDHCSGEQNASGGYALSLRSLPHKQRDKTHLYMVNLIIPSSVFK